MRKPTTLTEVLMEFERPTASERRIAQMGIDAHTDALISGAPPLDAARIGIETIDAAVRAWALEELPRPKA